MSTSVETGPSGTLNAPTGGLPRLYFVRFGFAIVWAVLVAVTASSLGPASIALLVIYPLFDVVAAVVDFRTSGASGPRVLLYVNMALSLITAVGVAIAATSGIPDVLRVWGAWAITAGLVQLFVAVRRYRLGGQWAMILSGGISTFAGTGFILMASGPNASLTGLAGYATLGGIFFLISALRLRQRASKVD
jgi:uncharacterized membrane protein HdeD (DUF308 family)